MTRLAALVAAVLACKGTAGAQELTPSEADARPVARFVIAAETCALFMQRRHNFPMFNIQWAMGYLEALNFAALRDGDDARQVFLPSVELERRLIVYCTQHPDDDLSFGVLKLYAQMPVIPGSQKEFQARPRN